MAWPREASVAGDHRAGVRVEDLVVHVVQVRHHEGAAREVVEVVRQGQHLHNARLDAAAVEDGEQHVVGILGIFLLEGDAHPIGHGVVGLHVDALREFLSVRRREPPPDHALPVGGDALLGDALGDGAEARGRVQAGVGRQHVDGETTLDQDGLVAGAAFAGPGLLAGDEGDGQDAVLLAEIEQPACAGVDLALAGGGEHVVAVGAVAPGGDEFPHGKPPWQGTE